MYNSWIDLPVVEAMEYFGGVIAQAFKWANHYAVLIGFAGLCWTGFRVAMSRMSIKDMWWDTMFKWVGFLLLMTAYPLLTTGMAAIANEIGYKAGAGEEKIANALKDLRTTLGQDLKTQQEWANGLETELRSKVEGINLSTNFGNYDNYNDYIDNIDYELSVYKFDSKKDRKEAQRLVEEYRNKSKSQTMFGAATLKAIDSILIEKELDGSEGENLTNSYVTLDLWLKDNEGQNTCYLSPSALLRVALLSCQVMFEKENTHFNKLTEETENNPELGFLDKAGAQINNHLQRIPQIIMTFFCCIVLILATIFACIQYVMTILEYTIVVGISAIFIPFMLFDGTKEIPKKFLPAFIGFMIKIVVINICIMFVFYLIVVNTMNTITDDAGMNWTVVAEVAFNSILAYILTSNAPKIAQTIMTGQPQLSMGEFIAGAATAGATAMGMAKTGVAGTRAAVKGGINAAGNIKQGISEAKSAAQTASSKTSQGIKDNGGTDAQAASAAKKAGFSAGAKGLVKGMFAQPTKDLANKVKAKGNDFIHGKTQFNAVNKLAGAGSWNGSPSAPTSGAGGNGGGSGPNGVKHTNPHERPNDFIGSAKLDNGQNMTIKQFMDEKGFNGEMAGEDIGNKTADKYISKFENGQQQNSGSNQESLPDNITGGNRVGS